MKSIEELKEKQADILKSGGGVKERRKRVKTTSDDDSVFGVQF